jgi:hypothetical protein
MSVFGHVLTVADWIGIIGLLVSAETAVVNGTIKLSNAIPDKWVPVVQAWCGILAFIGGGIITYLSRVVAMMIVAVIVLSVGPAMAQQGERGDVKGRQLKLIPLPAANPLDKLIAPAGANNGQGTSLDQFVAKVQALSLADFQFALAMSKVAGNNITTPCWQAWVDILSKQQQALTDANGKPLTMPDPHLITNVEIASEWIAQLQPNSAISTGCAPLAQAAQKDIGTMIGAVVSGGALGLLKLPFAL